MLEQGPGDMQSNRRKQQVLEELVRVSGQFHAEEPGNRSGHRQQQQQHVDRDVHCFARPPQQKRFVRRRARRAARHPEIDAQQRQEQHEGANRDVEIGQHQSGAGRRFAAQERAP